MDMTSCDKAAEILGKHPKTLRRLVKSGKLPGKFVGRECFVENSVLEGFADKPEKKPKEEKSVVTEDTFFQDDIDAIRRAKGKKAIAEAEIAQAEAEGLRDKPEVLAKREEEVALREEAVSRIELEQQDSRIKINEKIEQVRQYELEVKQRIALDTADIEEQQKECDEYISEREAYLQELETNIKNKGYELAKLTVKVEESVSDFNVKLEKIKDNCKIWMQHSFKYAARYTKLGERGNDVFYNRLTKVGNILFDCYDNFKPLLSWLETLEENPDLHIEDVQLNYDSRMNPLVDRVKKVIFVTNAALRNRNNGSR